MRQLILDDRRRFGAKLRRVKGGEKRNKCGEGSVTRKRDYARLTTDVAEEVVAGAG